MSGSEPAALIRPARRDDARACLEIYGPIVAGTHTSFEAEVPSVSAFGERIAATTRTHPWLVAVSDDDVAGFAYARPHRERAAYRFSVEVSVFVGEGFRRSGVGRRLYAELLDTLRRQGYYNAYAVISLPNETSVAFHESLGFALAGVFRKTGYKFGRWYDVGWWALRLKDDADPVKEPVPFPDV